MGAEIPDEVFVWEHCERTQVYTPITVDDLTRILSMADAIVNLPVSAALQSCSARRADKKITLTENIDE